jgi:hypothetical protein
MGRNRKAKRRKLASRPGGGREQSQLDPRLVAARVIGGAESLPDATWAVVVSPLLMKDGRELRWYPPQPVAFSLVEATRYRDRGVKERVAVMSQLTRREDGGWAPGNPRRTIDCLSDLQVAVLYAFTAIESLANHSIDQLDDEVTIDVEFKKGVVTQVPKADMVRRLNLDEKLSRVVPMLEDGANIKGTHAWERYRHLKDLRDDLLHVKERGYSPDPKEPTAYDRLLLGDGDECVSDAVAVVVGARPTFLPDFVLRVVNS